jgi:hypothetical protein
MYVRLGLKYELFAFNGIKYQSASSSKQIELTKSLRENVRSLHLKHLRTRRIYTYLKTPSAVVEVHAHTNSEVPLLAI